MGSELGTKGAFLAHLFILNLCGENLERSLHDLNPTVLESDFSSEGFI